MSKQAFLERLEALSEGFGGLDGLHINPETGRLENGRMFVDAEFDYSEPLGHVDVIAGPLDDPGDALSMRDCISGLGHTSDEAAQQCADIWVQSSGACVADLVLGESKHASFYGPDEPDSFPGWHSVLSPLVYRTFKDNDGNQELIDWFLATAPWAAISPAVAADLTRDTFNGVKILYSTGANPCAEVRINGVVSDAASAALAALPWPQREHYHLLRIYLVLMHRVPAESPTT